MEALWMIAGALAFSLMGATIKLLMSAQFSAYELVFWRGVVGVILMAIFMRWRGVSPASGRFGLHASRSIVGTIAMFGWFYTLGPLPLGTAITLNYSSPLFIAIAIAMLAWLRGAAQPGTQHATPRATHGRLYLAVVAGFVGVLVLLRPSVSAGQEFAVLVGVGAAMLSAAAYLQVRYLGRIGEPEWRTVFWFSIVNCVLGALAATMTGGWHALHLADIPALLAIGILAAIGQLCITRAFGRGGTLLTANLQYSGVVFATLIGWLAFDESLAMLELAGIALIVASGVAATLGSQAPAAPSPETAPP